MQKGFTLIELIITIFILSVAIVGVFGAFSMMVILTSDAADRLTAAYLAQEGMEIVRNIRDSNWLHMDFCVQNPADSTCANSPAWVDGLYACQSGCEADYTTTGWGGHVVYPWPTAGNYLNVINGFYKYDINNILHTKFKRKITTNTLGTDYIMKVTVQVSWDEKATVLNSAVKQDTQFICNPANCITAESTIYDWYNYLQSQTAP